MRSINDAADGRNTGIDVFRGLLVLAVVLGHFSELTRRDSLATWLGSGIRMPLFIGLSGYLFTLERARAMPLLALMRKYYPRLILPWLVACIVHLTITEQLNYATPVSVFLQPPFHLWFVPILMAFIIVASVTRLTPTAMLGLAIPISIAAMYLFGVAHTVGETRWWMPDRRFFVYPVYFFYGLWIARRTPDVRQYRAALMLAPIGFLWWCKLYYVPNAKAEVAAELISCIPLICLLPRIATLSHNLPAIGGIGRDSLFFYLWHPMAFALLASCGVQGLPMLFLSLLALVAARALCVRSASIARILGLPPRRSPTDNPSAIAASEAPAL